MFDSRATQKPRRKLSLKTALTPFQGGVEKVPLPPYFSTRFDKKKEFQSTW